MVRDLRTSKVPRLEVWPPRPVSTRRIALLSGSFDPITVAHEALAAAADAEADAVLLVYSVRTLPKEGGAAGPLLGEDERLDALERFCATRGLVAALCSHGLLADQAAGAGAAFPAASLTLVLGSDKLGQLFDRRWYEDRDAAVARLFAMASVAYAVRAGDESLVRRALAGAGAWSRRIRALDVDPSVAAVSSREVRERARAGLPFDDLVPREEVDVVRAAVERERQRS